MTNNKDFEIVDLNFANPNTGVSYSFKVRENTVDKNIVNEVIVADTYQLHSIMSNVGGGTWSPSVIVDMGAHIGSFTILANSLFPHSKIYSYEACKDNFDILELNVDNSIHNEHDNIKIENKVVCGTRLPTSMRSEGKAVSIGQKLPEQISDHNTGGRKFVYTGDKTLDVNYTTLPEIIESNSISQIDILKMDIEGSEYEVLRHMKEQNMLSRINCLICELHINENDDRYFYKFFDYLEEFRHITAAQLPGTKSRIVTCFL